MDNRICLLQKLRTFQEVPMEVLFCLSFGWLLEEALWYRVNIAEAIELTPTPLLLNRSSSCLSDPAFANSSMVCRPLYVALFHMNLFHGLALLVGKVLFYFVGYNIKVLCIATQDA